MVTAVLALTAATGLTPHASAVPSPTSATGVTTAQRGARSQVIQREKAWAHQPEIVESAAYARKHQAPPGAVEAAEKARAEDVATRGLSAASLRDNLYNAAKWYYDNQTITYTWSDYWEPCNTYQADCECFNRLVYWDAGWGQLYYTLHGQAVTGYYTSSPQYGDLVFFDYDGDGWEGPHDHTGIYTGGGWVLHSSATYGYVLWSKVSVISAETRGGHWYVNIVDA
jgi:hypothetical protein